MSSLATFIWQTILSPGMWFAPIVPLIVFFVIRRLGLRVQKIGMYLGAGILLGPSVLGLWYPQVIAFFFPFGLSPLQTFSNIATIAMGFLAGCHIANQNKHTTHPNDNKNMIAVSILQIGGIMLMTLIIGIITQQLYPTLGGKHPLLLLAALAVILPVNALSVLTATLIEENWQESRFGKLAMQLSVNTEIYLWPALTIISFFDTRSQAATLSSQMLRLVEIIVYIVCMYLLSRHVMPRLKNARIILQILVTLLVFWMSVNISEYLELHSLLGALLAGLITASITGPFTKKITLPIRFWIMPYFLFGVGFLVNFNFKSLEVWAIAAGLTIATTIVQTTIVSCMARWKFALSWEDSFALGILSLTRGKTDIIIMKQTMDMGFVTPTVYAAFVLMAFWQLCSSPVAAHYIRRSSQ